MQLIDFSRSYLRFFVDPSVQPTPTVTRPMPTSVSNVRITLDCRCELRHRETNESHEYVLGAPCKTELVGAERDIWMEPNADFCLVTSRDEFMVLKSWARCNMPVSKHPDAVGVPVERQAGRCRDVWTDYSFRCSPASGRVICSLDEIVAAIRSEQPIVARIQYDDGPWCVTIDHPVKTINYSDVDGVYQTDTGPILLPDLSAERLARGTRLIECFDLAYAAFNTVEWVELIINTPTPIGAGLSVNHYSKTRRIEKARNSLFELTDELPSSTRHVGAERGSRVDGAEVPLPVNGARMARQPVRDKH
ncbi:MAG: hypothetical protein WD468_08685 [Pirellulales bacterium]